MISRTSIFLVAFLGFFSTVYSNVKCPGKAEYELTVYYKWSNATHPNAVPMNGAHFSPLVGCSHSSGYKMFEAGMMATEGVKNVAETGNTTKLKYEIMKQMMYNKTTWKTFEASGKVNGTAHVSGLKVYATADYYMVSAIAMMVPSPDWFVGVAGVNLCDNGMWKENETAMSQPWDAGTKNGSMFDMGNAATNPPGYITVITKNPTPLSRFNRRYHATGQVHVEEGEQTNHALV
ncbi:hypothetical protein OS493_032906 [Desmophyllum pertusum]|uniref:Spondin domain-containing protein n=1 Tax=Desmophyllum pertusum TaxID=174260 RepID=A0A9X0CHS8_9CNID|nr:hypothetical protein OS493_032906 [Desmophyllum pertusum]